MISDYSKIKYLIAPSSVMFNKQIMRTCWDSRSQTSRPTSESSSKELNSDLSLTIRNVFKRATLEVIVF